MKLGRNLLSMLVAGSFLFVTNIQAQEIMRIKKILNEILSSHSNKSIKDLEKDTDRDNFMSAKQALSYGLIDKVVKKSK